MNMKYVAVDVTLAFTKSSLAIFCWIIVLAVSFWVYVAENTVDIIKAQKKSFKI